jgi:hypothetical protein
MRRLLSILCVLAASVSHAEESTRTEDGVSGIPGQHGITVCTLIASSTAVVNGEVFEVQVQYEPAINGSWSEFFVFRWPNDLLGFFERTIRNKRFVNQGDTVASTEIVVVPEAAAVEGAYKPFVVVTGADGEICAATGPVIVVSNP